VLCGSQRLNRGAVKGLTPSSYPDHSYNPTREVHGFTLIPGTDTAKSGEPDVTDLAHGDVAGNCVINELPAAAAAAATSSRALVLPVLSRRRAMVILVVCVHSRPYHPMHFRSSIDRQQQQAHAERKVPYACHSIIYTSLSVWKAGSQPVRASAFRRA